MTRRQTNYCTTCKQIVSPRHQAEQIDAKVVLHIVDGKARILRICEQCNSTLGEVELSWVATGSELLAHASSDLKILAIELAVKDAFDVPMKGVTRANYQRYRKHEYWLDVRVALQCVTCGAVVGVKGRSDTIHGSDFK